MREEEETLFMFGAVLCPKCEKGKITKGCVSVCGYDCSNHLEAAVHMICPKCGEMLLIQGDGKSISYNFNLEEHTCVSKPVIILSDDSEDETDEPKERS